MKNQHNLNSKVLIAISVLSLSLLTACGAKKSSDQLESASRIDITSNPSLASCNRLTNSNMSFSIANVVDTASGAVNPDWIKIKFSFLSTDMTQTGYFVKFYKWRIMGSTAQLDSTPMDFNSYLLSNGQTNSETMNAVFTTQINQQNGLYIRLNDDAQYPYQVLKVVIYKTDGTVAAQSDVLIPQFLASPIAYKTNSDGTVRADNLQKLHPLYSTDTTAWSQTQLKQYFDQYCF